MTKQNQPPVVTDEAVERALAAFNESINNPIMVPCERCEGRGYHHGFGEDGHDPDWCVDCGGNQFSVVPGEEERAMRAALESALSSGVRVRPLEWEKGVVDWAKPQPGMKYVACSTTPKGSWAWWLDDDPKTRAVLSSESEAKAAAQADYERRALSALSPAPTDTQEGLSEAGEVGKPKKVPEGQTPLNANLEHPLLDAIRAGGKSRDEGTGSPYGAHSLEHCLHATGWVQRDLRLALTACQQEVERLRAKVEELDGECQQSMLDICRERERAEIAEARNAELVKALEQIAMPKTGRTIEQSFDYFQSIARAALGGQSNEA